MSKTKVNKEFERLFSSILDGITADILKLDINPDDIIKVVNTIHGSHKNTTTKPKRQILPTNRCTRISKTGESCGAIKCNDVTKSCWGHMTKEEREEHTLRKEKSSSSDVSESYKIMKSNKSVQRAVEDLADE